MEEQGSDYGESKKHSREEHKDADAVRAAQGPLGILGISKLKWTGMGEFNSDDHYIYGQKSLIIE